ncbi:MAG: hypothetical protein QOI99_2005, partial [Actinomycetota bacterium]|nr:hypothetical protein [Actinomycetota bacterium]
MRKCVSGAVLLALALAAGVLAPAVAAGADDAPEYVVLYRTGASPAAARQAVQKAGGTLVKENAAVGLATVTSPNPDF